MKYDAADKEHNKIFLCLCYMHVSKYISSLDIERNITSAAPITTVAAASIVVERISTAVCLCSQ